MKIVNITMQAVNNYGSVLQTLATERIFRNLGYEVETLDYIQENLQMDSVWKVLKYGGPGWKIKCKQIILRLLKRKNTRRAEIMDEFRKKYLHLTKRYLSIKELEEDLPNADIFCTGSDQTWNPVLYGPSKAYYLAFVPDNKKKISFSASFGVDKLPAKDKSEVKELLSRYDAISVRESTGLNILENLGIHKAKMVLDPTLVISREFWENMCSKRLINEEYIFVYQLNTNKNFVDYVNRFAKKHRLRIIYVKSRLEKGYHNATYIDSPMVEGWLSLFKYANFVITDSFHGTVFSVIFHKEFVDIYPPHFSARLDSLLNLLQLNNRHIEKLNKVDFSEGKIDYTKVDSIIEKNRKDTIDFLKYNLK